MIKGGDESGTLEILAWISSMLRRSGEDKCKSGQGTQYQETILNIYRSRSKLKSRSKKRKVRST